MIWVEVVCFWCVGASLLGLALASVTYSAFDRREAHRGR